MRKYKAYVYRVHHYGDRGCSVRWGIRDPGARYHYHYHYHRVGGPAYVRYSPGGTINYQTWSLNGTTHHTKAEYQKALEKWLG